MRSKILAIMIVALFVCAGRCDAAWIWTPQSGKWVNPKAVVKATPEDQLEYARSLYESKSLDEALREFRKLLKNYPQSAAAAEAQYYLGLIDEARGRPYDAFKAYQKVIDKYPFSDRIQEMIERQFTLGEKFMTGRRTGDVPLAVVNPAIEIFLKVIENSAYGPLAPKAQYQIGLAFKGMLQYYEAEEAFGRVIANYPESEWAAPAHYQIAETRALMSKGAAYDQGAMQEAKQKFEEFIEEYPEAELSKDAEKNLARLNEQEAQSNYEIGRFYEKQKANTAAQRYYNEVITKYPGSVWSIRARERLLILEKQQ